MKFVLDHFTFFTLSLRFATICIFQILFYNALTAQAQSKCNSGNHGRLHLIGQLEHAKLNSPITKEIYKNYHLDQSNKPEQVQSGTRNLSNINCENKSVTTHHELQAEIDALAKTLSEKDLENRTDETAPLEDITKNGIDVEAELKKIPKTPPLLFKLECLQASNKFEIPGVFEVICPDDEKIKKTKLNHSCMTDEILNYQNAVITNLYGCMKSLNLAVIEPRYLFELYNLESGFNPHFYSTGGRGLGQLTSIFVHNNHQSHRGLSIMQQIETSTNPECQVAKKISENALVNPPITIKYDEAKFNGYCPVTSIGNGLELNILYTLVGLASSWKDDIGPLLTNYIEKHHSQEKKISQIKSLALLNAYGASGPVAAMTTVLRLRNRDPKGFIKGIQKQLTTEDGTNLTGYIRKINEKASALKETLPKKLKKKYDDEGGEACINSKAL